MRQTVSEKVEIKCPECQSKNLINDHYRGEIFCGSCGLVLDDEIIDMGPEWRAFNQEQWRKKARAGAPLTCTIYDNGLSTLIDRKNKDIHGRNLPPENLFQWYRIRKLQQKTFISGTKEKNLIFALRELEKNSSLLELPKIVTEDASMIYRQAIKKNLIICYGIIRVGAASLYIACRRMKIPRTLNEIADVCRVSKKELGRTYLSIIRGLNIKLPITSPSDYVPRFNSELNLPSEIQTEAIEICEVATKKGLTIGKEPQGVAAAAIYISTYRDQKKTQKELAEVAGVSDVTIRKRMNELLEQINWKFALR